jgi:predicted dehydrogenase/nucleoside-diphosphate-sugar epimerase
VPHEGIEVVMKVTASAEVGQAGVADTLRAGAAGAAQPVNAERPKLRVALIGCGAIAQQRHLPVLAGHERIDLVALVDRDVQRAGKLARGYGVHRVLADAGELAADQVEGAIIATPPSHHAPCAIELMRRGIHVLVEKPIALNLAEAEDMVRAAERAEVVLSVGLYRRLYPGMRLMKSLLESQWLGRPRRFRVEGGGMYGWEAATLGNMRKELAGGGVLMDFGSHILDLLLSLFDEPAEILDYCDNAHGGIESDCSLKLRLRHGQEPVAGTVELARTRNLGAFLEVDCERGRLTFQLTDPYRVWVTPFGLELHDPQDERGRPLAMQACWADIKESPSWGYELFRAEIDDWLEAVRGGGAPRLSGRSALASMRLIDECYRRPRAMPEPWVRTWPAAAPRQETANHEAVSGLNGHARPPAQKLKVLLTGATGFIGSRLAEIMHIREGWQVRALVHNPGHASRLARLPVDMVQGDLRSEQDVRRLVEGCDAVIHCAIGTDWGQRREIFAVTVDGTRRLAEAARAAGVRRFVHFSTISVYGDEGAMTGPIDESTPVRPTPGSIYGESKAEAERVLLRLAARGLPAVLLRPARVYGPASRTFITNPIQAMAEGRFHWLGSPDVPCDMVYVDNLAEAALLALQAPADKVRGEVFAISDGDPMTWREFYAYFADALGLDLSAVPSDPPPGSRRAGFLGSLLRWPQSWYRGLREVFGSREFRALGRKVLETDPLGTFPRWALRRAPVLERALRRMVGADGALPVYRRTPAAPANVVHMGSGGALVSIQKAQRLLGYRPPVSRARALELTLDWIRHANLVK